MKRACAIVLSLVTCCWNIPIAAQNNHFTTHVLYQNGTPNGAGNGESDYQVWRHSNVTGGQAVIGAHISSYDDGYNVNYQIGGYINVYTLNWTFLYQDTFWASIGGFRQDNGNGTTTTWIWPVLTINGLALAYGDTTAYTESNDVLAQAPWTALQNVMGLIDGEAHGPFTMFGVNWKCMILAANDPICDELAVIFGPEAWLPCVLVIYELCVHVEQLPPL